MLSLEEIQDRLAVTMSDAGLRENQVIGIVLLLQRNRKEMEDLILYIADNNPSPVQIMRKAEELKKRTLKR